MEEFEEKDDSQLVQYFPVVEDTLGFKKIPNYLEWSGIENCRMKNLDLY